MNRYSVIMQCVFLVPTAVRDVTPDGDKFTPESIFISWDHPEYPNSQLINYTLYFTKSEIRQPFDNISSDGYNRLEKLGIIKSYNLTGLIPYINYSILVTVSGMGVSDAPFDVEILNRTDPTGKVVTNWNLVRIKVYHILTFSIIFI